MSKEKVTWKDLEKYLRRHGYEIRPQGGDKIIIAPKSDQSARRSRAPVRIGHKFCVGKHELLPVHLAKLKRAFGITPEDILNG